MRTPGRCWGWQRAKFPIFLKPKKKLCQFPHQRCDKNQQICQPYVCVVCTRPLTVYSCNSLSLLLSANSNCLRLGSLEMSTELSTVPTDSACRSVAATDSACRSVAASLVSSILSTSTTNAVIKARTGLWNVSERSKTAPSPSLTTFKFVKSPTVISHSVDMNMVPSTSSKIFSFAEDKRLYELIEKGEQDWAVISKVSRWKERTCS